MKDTNKTQIVIEVYGGVASVVQTIKGVTVTIKDRDHKCTMKNIDGLNCPVRRRYKS